MEKQLHRFKRLKNKVNNSVVEQKLKLDVLICPFGFINMNEKHVCYMYAAGTLGLLELQLCIVILGPEVSFQFVCT